MLVGTGKRSPWFGAVAVGGVVLILGLVYTRGLWAYWDLNATDEGLYIYRASLWLFHGQSIPLEWGPLYHYWYAWLISLTDPPTAFYLNLYATYLIPPVLLSIVAFCITRHAFGSILVAVAFLISWGHHGDWRVNHFLLGMVLLALLPLPFLDTKERKPLMLSLQAWAALLTYFIRPEMLVAALLFWGWSGLAVGKAWSSLRLSRQRWGILASLAAFLLVLAWLQPWSTPKGRSLGAFGQHFAVRWVHRTGSSLNPYADWEIVLTEQFGQVTSIAQAFLRRPDLVGWFVYRNIRGWFLVLAQRVSPYLWRKWWALNALTLLLLVGLVVWKAQRRWRLSLTPEALQKDDVKQWLWLLLIWSVPSVLASWLMYPRPHYQAVLLGMGWLGFAIVLAVAFPQPRHRDWGWAAVLTVFAFVLTLLGAYPEQARPRLQTVCDLRAAIATVSSPTIGIVGHIPMAVYYTSDRLTAISLQPSSKEEIQRHPPSLWAPWPPSAEWQQRLPDWSYIASPANGYHLVTLADGSRWLTRIPVTAFSSTLHPPTYGSVCGEP